MSAKFDPVPVAADALDHAADLLAPRVGEWGTIYLADEDPAVVRTSELVLDAVTAGVDKAMSGRGRVTGSYYWRQCRQEVTDACLDALHTSVGEFWAARPLPRLVPALRDVARSLRAPEPPRSEQPPPPAGDLSVWAMAGSIALVFVSLAVLVLVVVVAANGFRDLWSL